MVTSSEHAGNGYAEEVGEWIANPHAYFKAFGPEARAFQRKHPSERLRTMTLVAPAAELAAKTYRTGMKAGAAYQALLV